MKNQHWFWYQLGAVQHLVPVSMLIMMNGAIWHYYAIMQSLMWRSHFWDNTSLILGTILNPHQTNLMHQYPHPNKVKQHYSCIFHETSLYVFDIKEHPDRQNYNLSIRQVRSTVSWSSIHKAILKIDYSNHTSIFGTSGWSIGGFT